MSSIRPSISSMSGVRPASRGDRSDGIKRVQRFLQEFGYLKSRSFKSGILDAATSNALRTYQAFMRLEVTGVVDRATIDEMSQPRCGMPDIRDLRRFRRLVSWEKLDLTYAFDVGPNDLDAGMAFDAVRNAFQTWAAVIPVTFREVPLTQTHDIRISWTPSVAPDHEYVEGRLAHADFPFRTGVYEPSLPLPLHFIDEGFTWVIGAVPFGYDIETMALHEIGHLLGLDHSTTVPSVMIAMSGNPNSVFRELQPDDIAAVQGLYTRITRQGDSDDLAGEASAIAAIRHATQQVVTAVRDGSNRLLLISWRVNDDGSVSRTGHSGDQAGELAFDDADMGAGIVDIARGSRYVVACRTVVGKLKLISWDVSDAGVISRSGDSADQAGTAQVVKIVALSDSLFVTACQSGSGNLLLISWRLNADGSLTRLHDSGSAAGAVSEIALLDVSLSNAGDRVATAVRNGSGKLQLIIWSVAADGAIARLSHKLAGEATLIRAVRDSLGHVITACRTGNGRLKLIAWSVSASGDDVVRLYDSYNQAGEISDLALMSRPNGFLVTAVRNASDRLQLILWVIEDDRVVLRSQSPGQLTGEASLINLCQEPLDGIAPIVTAVRTGSMNLKLISWRD